MEISMSTYIISAQKKGRIKSAFMSRMRIRIPWGSWKNAIYWKLTVMRMVSLFSFYNEERKIRGKTERFHRKRVNASQWKRFFVQLYLLAPLFLKAVIGGQRVFADFVQQALRLQLERQRRVQQLLVAVKWAALLAGQEEIGRLEGEIASIAYID